MKKVISIIVALALMLSLSIVATPVLADVTAADVIVNPKYQGEEAEYTITFNITGELTGGLHTIAVKFPESTHVPATATFETGDITVRTGAVTSPVLKGEVTVVGTTVTFYAPVFVPVGEVVVVFTKAAGIKNPPQETYNYNTYNLWVNTSRPADQTAIKSKPYIIVLGPYSHYKFVYDDPTDIWVGSPVEFDLTVTTDVLGQEGYNGVYIFFDPDDPANVSVEVLKSEEPDVWEELIGGKWGPFDLKPQDEKAFRFRFTFDKVGVYSIGLELGEDPGPPIAKGEVVTAVVTGVSVQVELNKGWNLISLPVVPDNSAIAQVLETIEDDFISVHYYSVATKKWLIYSPLVTTLTTMEDGKSYWINMKNKTNLTVIGQAVAPPGYGDPPPSYSVVKGWNMVGFRSMDSMKADEYLKGTEYVRIYGFDLKQGGWFPLAFSANMTPGLGYWVAFSEPGTIYP